jgi:hypothetical protein
VSRRLAAGTRRVRSITPEARSVHTVGMVDRAPSGMRRFVMHRAADVSGVSGVGLVLEGVHFSTGVVVVHWLTPPPRGSISVFDSMDQFLAIHVRPHPDNGTMIEFEDGDQIVAVGEPASTP